MMFLLAIALFGFSATMATNYCDTRLCDTGKVNIGCNNPGKVQCTGKPRVFSTADIQLTLDAHNKLRQKIASGGQAGFPGALRMTTMVWNAELAALAVLNVDQCTMNHDACRSTDQFHYAGQNLAISWSWGSPVEPFETAVPNMIQGWYAEFENATVANIDSYPSSPPNPIGHFTQVVGDQAYQVGCAFIYFKDADDWDTNLLACNYAFTNMLGSPVYAKVTSSTPKVASKCTTGVNPTYSALCSVNEVVTLPRRF